MTTLLGLSSYQSEALIACLVASVIWAGMLLLGAMHLERRGAASGDRLWIGALLLAILPSLAAPSLAAFGVSLRPAPMELSVSGPAEAPMPVPGARTIAENQTAPAPDTTAWRRDQAIQALALLYVYGAALAFFIWASRQAGFLIAAGLAEPVRNESLLRAASDWAAELGVRAPRLKRSRHVSSVCIYGAVAPVILMPHDLEARVAERDIALMCAHEIAHLKRGDTRLFTATALARVLFWFNPLVTRIAGNVELAAEEGADQLVIGSGVDRRAYASCFVRGLKFAAMKQSLLPALSPSFTPNDRQGRRRRLDSILSANGERRTPAASRAALAGAASIAALLAVGQAAFAVDPEAAVEKKRLAALAGAERLNDADPVLASPVEGEVSLGFGKTYISLEDNRTPVDHRGLDIKALKGAPVKASGDGVVVEATKRLPGKESYGTTVVIDHGHGLLSRYAHLDSYKVQIGQKVKKGDVIGAVGDTGRVTGPHLHFEVLKHGKPVDPSVATAPEAPEPPEAPQWPDAALPAEPAEPPEPDDPMAAIWMSDDDADPAIRYAFKEADGFAFADGDALTDKMEAEIEGQLLGDLEIGANADYDIELSIDGKTQRFSSDEPMTPEKRAALKAAIDEMKAHRDAARKEMERAQKEWRKTAVVAKRDAEKFASEARAFAFRFEGEDAERAVEEDARLAMEEARREEHDARREALEAEREAREEMRLAEEEARREALETEREALVAEIEAIADARDDLEDALDDGLEEALDDLAREEDAMEAEDLSDEERKITRTALAEARRGIERARGDHERQIERARRELERHEATIVRKLDALDANSDTRN